MAKLDMERVQIFAPKSQQRAIIKALQSMAILDVSAAEEKPPEGFFRRRCENEEDRRCAQNADNALKILNRISPEKKGLLASFSGRRQVSLDEFFSAGEKTEEINSICDDIVKAERKIAEIKAETVRINTFIEQLSPWNELDVPLSFSGTDKTVAFIGTFQGSLTLEELLSGFAKAKPELELYAEIVGYAAGQTLVFLTSARSDEKVAEEMLRSSGFSRPSQSCDVTPQEKINELRQNMVALEKEMKFHKDRIASFADRRQDIELTYDWYLSKAERAEVQGVVDETVHTVMITGYVPTCDLPILRQKLEDNFTVYIEDTPADEEVAPVKLKNNAFTEPAQSITSMYALPSSKDIDPTPITSFFYYLFFGIMLSDAGYGILMWIATWAVNRFLNPEPNMRKNMKLFMYCGISTTLWGFFFGSFFGVDIITAISKAITGHGLPFKYPFINPLEGDALAMLILSVALGFIQIIAGLCVKFYITAKDESLLDAVFDTGLWITTLTGFGIMAIGLVGIPVLQTVGIIIAVVSMLGLVVTGGRKKKGVMKIFGGVASLYDITSYVSDLLSFSRLMALGLTTAAMSMVFNKLGVMVSAGVAGKIFMVVILLVGHAINFGLNALGAYVHTLRLQYVELFSKFYEGGGRQFMPFAFKGKYVRIKEEK